MKTCLFYDWFRNIICFNSLLKRLDTQIRGDEREMIKAALSINEIGKINLYNFGNFVNHLHIDRNITWKILTERSTKNWQRYSSCKWSSYKNFKFCWVSPGSWLGFAGKKGSIFWLIFLRILSISVMGYPYTITLMLYHFMYKDL